MDPLWSETCWSTFKYFIILIVSTYYILCISWIIKCLIGFLSSLSLWCSSYFLLFSLLFTPASYSTFMFAFPDFSSLFDSIFFSPQLFRTYCLAFLRLIYPGFLPPRTVFDTRAVRMNLEWRDLHWMRLSLGTAALACQSAFVYCVIFKLICQHDTL